MNLDLWPGIWLCGPLNSCASLFPLLDGEEGQAEIDGDGLLGTKCAAMILEWLEIAAAGEGNRKRPRRGAAPGLLWKSAPYQEEAPAISSVRELAGGSSICNMPFQAL